MVGRGYGRFGEGARETCDSWHYIHFEGPVLLEIIMICLIHSDATAVPRLLLGEIDYCLLNKE